MEHKAIIEAYHMSPYVGHFVGRKIATKILQCEFFWPSLFIDAHLFVYGCDHCQRTCNVSQKNEMLVTHILRVEIFNLWGIDFMGHFPLL